MVIKFDFNFSLSFLFFLFFFFFFLAIMFTSVLYFLLAFSTLGQFSSIRRSMAAFIESIPMIE